MIYEAEDFVFVPPRELAFARRILLKPDAGVPLPYPHTTSSELLAHIIEAISQVSSAEIIILEGSRSGESMKKIFKALKYDFPRVTLLDVRESTPVEIENPLPRPYAISTFWIPNIILSCDFLISISTFKITGGNANFTIWNLLGLLPPAKYHGEMMGPEELGQRFGIHCVVADLYFTLPFDLGIIEARKKLTSPENSRRKKKKEENFGKIFMGSPLEVDKEAAHHAGIEVDYVRLIEAARVRMEGQKANRSSKSSPSK